MAFQKRAPSLDMASIELRSSPAPTYTSTCKAEDWPLTPQHTSFSSGAKGSMSNNPYYQSTTANAVPLPFRATSEQTRKEMDDGDVSPVKPDYHDPNHPHYVEPSTKLYTHPSPLIPPRSRWPRKRVLVPWLLAALFFLTTLWFTSIALGARYLSILHPFPSNPASQEINIFIDGEALRGAVSQPTTAPTTSMSSTPSISWTIGETSTDSSNANPSATGRLQLAPTGQPSLEDIDGRLERLSGFVTVTRRSV
jgi:hypothetical protein